MDTLHILPCGDDKMKNLLRIFMTPAGKWKMVELVRLTSKLVLSSQLQIRSFNPFPSSRTTLLAKNIILPRSNCLYRVHYAYINQTNIQYKSYQELEKSFPSFLYSFSFDSSTYGHQNNLDQLQETHQVKVLGNITKKRPGMLGNKSNDKQTGFNKNKTDKKEEDRATYHQSHQFFL